MRQKNDISSIEVSVEVGPPSFVCDTVAGSCAIRQGSSDTKNEYNLFLSEIGCWIFFYSTIFSKKAVFSEKTVKNHFGGEFDSFLGKKGVLP